MSVHYIYRFPCRQMRYKLQRRQSTSQNADRTHRSFSSLRLPLLTSVFHLFHLFLFLFLCCFFTLQSVITLLLASVSWLSQRCIANAMRCVDWLHMRHQLQPPLELELLRQQEAITCATSVETYFRIHSPLARKWVTLAAHTHTHCTKHWARYAMLESGPMILMALGRQSSGLVGLSSHTHSLRLQPHERTHRSTPHTHFSNVL